MNDSTQQNTSRGAGAADGLRGDHERPTLLDLSLVRICEQRCETCIFSSRSPVRAGRRADLQRTWKRDDTFQNCHYGTVTGDKALMCRGFYDWCVAVGWFPTLLQLGERLDRIRFVPVPEVAI